MACSVAIAKRGLPCTSQTTEARIMHMLSPCQVMLPTSADEIWWKHCTRRWHYGHYYVCYTVHVNIVSVSPLLSLLRHPGKHAKTTKQRDDSNKKKREKNLFFFRSLVEVYNWTARHCHHIKLQDSGEIDWLTMHTPPSMPHTCSHTNPTSQSHGHHRRPHPRQ